MSNDHFINLSENQNLEETLIAEVDSSFPKYKEDKGEISYPERYKRLKADLVKVHDEVEIGAMVDSIDSWIEENINKIKNEKDVEIQKEIIKSLENSDYVIYLNNHGRGHVEKVIEKISEILSHSNNCGISAYEAFLLLSAVQIHDAGNYFGRNEHESASRSILEQYGKNHIADSIERKIIQQVALVHSGVNDGDKDTIGNLKEEEIIFGKKIRPRFLSALLRFGDELADDKSRANQIGLENKKIPKNCLIFHRYSESLHTVLIDNESNKKKLIVYLAYCFFSDIAQERFSRNGNDIYLLDEIYNRTLKMERERRYCMQFLRPYISIDQIRVDIEIQNITNLYDHHHYQYSLEENGYPAIPSSGKIKDFAPLAISGEEEFLLIKRDWDGT